MSIILTILAFHFWWPLGLILVGYFIARRRFGYGRGPMCAVDANPETWNRYTARWERKFDRAQMKMERVRDKMERRFGFGGWGAPASSGNNAFDNYRAETLRRLEDEQREFQDFLGRLRDAKDRAEFDQFMNDRRQRPFDAGPEGAPNP